MKTTLWLTLALSVSACGGPGGTDNNGYGHHYDVLGKNNLRVRYMPEQTKPTLFVLEEIFASTQECTGIHRANGPLIIFIDTFPGEENIGGKTFFGSGTIVIATYGQPTAQRITAVLRHEFVHHLLHQSGFDAARNTNHGSQLFDVCAE